MKGELFALVLGLSFSTVSRADTALELPVEVVNSSSVEIRGASATRDESGLRTHGWVKRKLGHFGPVSAHLHVEGLDSHGSTLQLVETNLVGNLPSRTRTPARFSANFTLSQPDQIARVRVSVQPGRHHETIN